MNRAYKALRKAFIFVVGFLVIIIGIILIPLPGPGIFICIGGLAILAIEFEWAERHLKRAKAKLKQIVAKSRPKKKS